MARTPGWRWVIPVLSRLLGHLSRLISVFFFAGTEEFLGPDLSPLQPIFPGGVCFESSTDASSLFQSFPRFFEVLVAILTVCFLFPQVQLDKSLILNIKL